jgi:multidrug transporter EmrE-like cation transporter
MIAAIPFEVAGTTCMKLSDGFRKLISVAYTDNRSGGAA